MRTTDTHVYFWNGIYSNWYKCPVCDPDPSGRIFANTEQAFMWFKARHFGDEEMAEKIEKTTNPREVKKLGRQVKGFVAEEWDKVCFDYMVKVNQWKFSEYEMLRKELVDTGDKIIVEASPLDTIWGVGLAEDDDAILDEKNWKGKNLLGKALMEVRRRVKLLG